MIAVYSFDSFSRGAILPTPLIPSEVTGVEAIPADMWFTAIAKGIAEVMFADSIIVGVLFLIGIAIVSLRGAAMALTGAVVGVLVSTLLGASQTLVEMGLYGFNPVLTMMAVGWVFLKPSGRSAVLALLAGIVTVVCQAGLANFLTPVGLPTLTFPFVLVMWMFLFAAGKSKYWSDIAK